MSPTANRNPSATRIAVSLGAAVAVVMLAIWGATAIASAMLGDLKPVPKATRIVAKAETTQPVEPAETTPTGSATITSVETKAPEPVRPAPVTPAPKPKPAASGFVVVIDPGHQAHGDNALEPIGPGASEKKPKVTSGAAGVSTRQLESEFNLAVALKLRDRLEAQGVKVIMVRTSQSVNIPNSQRAAVANKAKADLFIRIHADSVDNSSLTGYLTLVPGKNQWTGPIVSSSAKAGRLLHLAALASTRQKDRGITPRTDMSGFNWAKVPSVIVEAGMLSNSSEDRLLKTDAYRAKLASGLAKGTMAYLDTLR